MLQLHCFEKVGSFLEAFRAVVQEGGHWYYCSPTYRLALDSLCVVYYYCFASLPAVVVAAVVVELTEEIAIQEVELEVVVESTTREVSLVARLK